MLRRGLVTSGRIRECPVVLAAPRRRLAAALDLMAQCV